IDLDVEIEVPLSDDTGRGKSGRAEGKHRLQRDFGARFFVELAHRAATQPLLAALLGFDEPRRKLPKTAQRFLFGDWPYFARPKRDGRAQRRTQQHLSRPRLVAKVRRDDDRVERFAHHDVVEKRLAHGTVGKLRAKLEPAKDEVRAARRVLGTIAVDGELG